MLPSLAAALEAELRALRDNDRLRECPTLEGAGRVRVTVGDRPLISFSSNDYLGLASHPALRAAAEAALASEGTGASASRLVSGDLPSLRALERALAGFLQLPAALVFPTGYQANIGVITALASRGDLVLSDSANHASLIDGCRLSRAEIAVYPHRDVDALAEILVATAGRPGRRLIVTESVFSMDGDLAPIQALAELARRHDAALVVDEAHALGCLGPSGRGLCAAAGITPDALVGTLGKAFGAGGGFIAGDDLLRRLLVNRARTFIFTTALPPPVAAAAAAAVSLAAGPAGDELRHRLARNMEVLAPGARSPIVPVVLGADADAVRASAWLRERGFFVQAIRPPTVPPATARLRVTLSAAHTADEVAALAAALAELPRPHQLAAPPRPARRRLRGLFVAGTDTGVGKTAVATAILRHLHRTGQPGLPFKPCESGFTGGIGDAERLLAASGRSDVDLGDVRPHAFAPPVAPALAAELAGTPLTLADLIAAADRLATRGGLLITEAAGGLLSPYTPTATAADLASDLALPVLLVARNSLGTINHTALAIAELRRRRLKLAGLVLVDTTLDEAPDRAHNARLIAALTGVRAAGVLPYVHDLDADRLADALEAAVDVAALLLA